MKKLKLNELKINSFETSVKIKAGDGGEFEDSHLSTYSSTKDVNGFCTLMMGCDTKIKNTVCIRVY